MTKINETLPGLSPPNEWRSASISRPDLPPCPFCNGSPHAVTWAHPAWAVKWQIICHNKECKVIAGTLRQPTMDEAIRIWSFRPGVKVDLDVLGILKDEDFHIA